MKISVDAEYLEELEEKAKRHDFFEGYIKGIEVAFAFAEELVKDIGNRKTKNSSEIPNNCEVKNYCDDCLYTDTCDSKAFFYACTSKATISKMEQVDEPKTQMKTQNSNLTFEKADEPQTDCKTCKHSSKEEESDECYLCSMYYNDNYEPQTFVADGMLFAKVDEPQTDCPWK